MSIPAELAINAWTGVAGGNEGAVAPDARNWGALARARRPEGTAAAPPPADRADWRHKDVGWGIVLPENEEASKEERARGDDAPAAIRDLLLARAPAPVFRYRPTANFQRLRRYYVDRCAQDLEIASTALRGIGVGCLPQYLLLCGSPADLPWELQFVLSGPCRIGRLDLPDAALRRYVDALIADFPGGASACERVVWATDHADTDITRLMRRVVAEPLAAKFKGDSDIGPEHVAELLGDGATVSALRDALIARNPGLVVTASHGMTGPLSDVPAMRQQLGLLVDQQRALVSTALLAGWQPDGCVWYAHACCSAGSNAPTQYVGLVAAGSSVEETLLKIAECGPVVAPFPTALLSADKPARAFIGHVEPTFNWTLRSPATGQVLTQSLVETIYTGLHQATPQPIGLAFDPWYRSVGELMTRAAHARRGFTAADAKIRESARAEAARTELAALDRGSLVILGDPTVCLPPLR